MENVVSIVEIENLKLGNLGTLNGSNGSRLGMTAMFKGLMGYASYDGYKITTTKHSYFILIDNGQCCCETWGYFASNDNFNDFIGKSLLSVELTDKALNTKKVEENKYYEDEGGILFVNFNMADNTVLQFAVYNAHNGYYGHPIIFAKDDDIILQDVL